MPIEQDLHALLDEREYLALAHNSTTQDNALRADEVDAGQRQVVCFQNPGWVIERQEERIP